MRIFQKLVALNLLIIATGCGKAPDRLTLGKSYASNSDAAGKKPIVKAFESETDSNKKYSKGADPKEPLKTDPVSEPGTVPEKENDLEKEDVEKQKEPEKEPVASGDICANLNWTNIKKPEDAVCFQSIPKAFAALPDAVKPFFVLMQDSRSAQRSTLDNPRVIVYSPDGSFLIGSATDPDARKDLEVAVFDYENSQWNFAGIDFSVSPPKIEKDLCKTCHGAEPHPIWKSYGSWTGAFAENNFLKAEEADLLNKLAKGETNHEILKNLKYESRYSSGSRMAPAVRLRNGEENGQVLNYVTIQKAAQKLAGKLVKNPAVTALDLLAISAEITCETGSGALQKFGLKIADEMQLGLEGSYRQSNTVNGRFSQNVYIATEILGRAFIKDPSLKEKLPDAARVFADKRMGYWQSKGINDFVAWQKLANVSIRNANTDFLSETVNPALESSAHCSAVRDLTGN